ncbi:hypothetical protein ACFWVC_28040 [Streptomyces sp. NPDC058691]|uniref:hypothetical protein n=1 Tax=Streptomyces sp. NPDC058691 TaxID=3346601 RepID=UPI0036616986
MKGTRVSALLVGLTAALTLAACGVPPSDVIQAGPAASGMSSPDVMAAEPTVAYLYFLRNGDLAPYPRKIGAPGDFGAVLGSLFDGPTTDESATASTELPRLGATPKVTLGGDNTLSIRLPNDVPPFSHLAMRQLACTMAPAISPTRALPKEASGSGGDGAPSAGALHSSAHSNVQVLGDGWTKTQSDESCPVSPQP